MLNETITVTLPKTTFHKLKRSAEITQRSIDDILTSAVDALLTSPTDNLPAEYAEELAAMHLLSDESLWQATQPLMSSLQNFRT